MADSPKPLVPFSSWVGPRQPKLLILGEAWGEGEQIVREPFVGYSGKELWLMLGESFGDVAPEAHQQAVSMFKYDLAWVKHRRPWLEQSSIAMTNVFNFRPTSNKLEYILCPKKEACGASQALGSVAKGGYLMEEYLPELERLKAELEQSRPNLVLACGNTAIWALLGSTNIGSIRGSIADSQRLVNVKVLPTYHPAGVMRQWSWRPIVVADLIKARREMEFPEIIRPEREVFINPTLEECQQFVSRLESNPPEILSIDVETGFGQIKCISFSSSPFESFVIPFFHQGHPSGSYWPTLELEREVWELVRRLCSLSSAKLGQNFLYDLQYITRMGIFPTNCTQDTMLFHHSLFPEMQKGLGFLGSIYTNEASWKLMRRKRPDTEKRDE